MSIKNKPRLLDYLGEQPDYSKKKENEMAAVPVVIVGSIKDNDSGEEKQVTITGLASLQGLGVGGGPVYPPGIWGPTDPRPGVGPIVPGMPGWGENRPPHIWGGGNEPFPTPPIPIYPGGSPNPPGGGGGEHEPKFEWKTGWTPETGWVVVAIPQFPHVTPSSE